MAMVMYSIMLRSASRCSWVSMAQGSRVISRTTDSHEASWPGASHNSACSSAGNSACSSAGNAACSSAGNSSAAVMPREYQLQVQVPGRLAVVASGMTQQRLADSRDVDARHDAVRGAAHASQLLGRQDVDDERPYVRHVRGGHLGEGLEALLGQDGM